MKFSEPAVPADITFKPPGLRRRLVLVSLYGTLIAAGLLLGHRLVEVPYLFVQSGHEASLGRVVVTAIVIYILVAALPFVPAAEIGLGLMLMFGPETAVLVYMSTVLAFTLAYLVGRAIPADACATAFAFVGLRRAQALALEMATLDAHARQELFLKRAPRHIAPSLLRHRYLALAVAFHIPGNTLLGGGGGIALMAGASGLYPLPAYLLTVAIAVAPVPLLVALSTLLP